MDMISDVQEYVVAAYAVSGVLIGGLTLCIVFEYRRARRALSRIEHADET